MELALSLEKLNFQKLRALHAVASKHEDASMSDFVGRCGCWWVQLVTDGCRCVFYGWLRVGVGGCRCWCVRVILQGGRAVKRVDSSHETRA